MCGRCGAIFQVPSSKFRYSRGFFRVSLTVISLRMGPTEDRQRIWNFQFNRFWGLNPAGFLSEARTGIGIQSKDPCRECWWRNIKQVVLFFFKLAQGFWQKFKRKLGFLSLQKDNRGCQKIAKELFYSRRTPFPDEGVFDRQPCSTVYFWVQFV